MEIESLNRAHALKIDLTVIIARLREIDGVLEGIRQLAVVCNDPAEAARMKSDIKMITKKLADLNGVLK